MIAEVILAMGGKDVLDYHIPNGWDTKLTGRRVVVPLGNRKVQGMVRKTKMESSFGVLREIVAILDDAPILSGELLDLHQWVSEYYLTPLSTVLELSFPKNVKAVQQKKVVPVEENLLHALLTPDEEALLARIRKEQVSYPALFSSAHWRPVLESMLRQGYLILENRYQKRRQVVAEAGVAFIRMPDKLPRPGSKGEKLLEFLREYGPTRRSSLREQTFYDSALLRKFLSMGVIGEVDLEGPLAQDVLSALSAHLQRKEIILTPEQNEVLCALENQDVRPALLFGVTGSGKTEIYMERIARILAEGKSALYMVPEIALVNQTARRLQSRLQRPVLYWHSRMTEKEKQITWEALQEPGAHLILGARSAIFAPVANLGLIIVDEEHETSYKQNEPDPRYNGVEAAIQRAAFSGAHLIMGSATPSLDRYYRAQQGEFSLHIMKNRPAKARLPLVEVVDLKEEFKKGNRSIFSTLLQEQIQQALYRKEQIILFLNRRGFSRFVLCRECGHVVVCRDCSVPMILHKNPDQLKCHYCEQTGPIPKECPSCHSRFIKDMGIGTQKIEDLLYETFPGVRVTRLDQDMVREQDSHEGLLEEFASGKSDILLGTQMVVKGLDFSRVTLVGILSADMSLNVPDLYASERTFQLLTQVSGRAGRGDKAGSVVIQTYNPQHFSIQTARNHNYPGFYDQEMKERKIMGYPPFSRMIRFLFTGENLEDTRSCSENFARQLEEKFPRAEILGPSEAPVARIKNRHRYHIIVKTTENILHNHLKENYNKMKTSGQKQGIRILIDVDPYLIL